jgi:hypothetical protein
MKVVSSQILEVGGATIQVDFASGALGPNAAIVLPWIQQAANAVTIYYGRFPVPRARILIVPVPGAVLHGTTWGAVGGVPAFTRIVFGEETTEQDLANDWRLTHEMVHMAFPSLPDEQHWMEEGLASYIEPIARPERAAVSETDMGRYGARDAPGRTDQRRSWPDNTHTWGRTYWGGAMFCLVADITIREKTGNQKGLQDALRAIVASGRTIDKEASLLETLQIGDRATGTSVLSDM